MRIACIIATRGRHQRAGGVIECARNLLSGQHEVEFIVALDADDDESIEYFTRFDGVMLCIQPRPIGVGDCWNRAARLYPRDYYLCLPDDAWICTPGWDAYMVNSLEKGVGGNLYAAQLGIISWYDAVQPTIASIFGMSTKWIEANGFVFDPRFPFWFGDSALVETAIFATGEGMPGTGSLQFASRPGNVNPRLRDMELWWALFAATRHERVETAEKIRRNAGLPEVNGFMLARLVRECEERDAGGVREIPNVLATIAEPKPADAEYLAAKVAAEAYLAQCTGRDWGYAGEPAVISAVGS